MERMNFINERFGKALNTVKGYEDALLGRVRNWDRFEESRRAVASLIQEAQALLAVGHLESEEDFKSHRAFFEKDNECLIRDMLECSSALENTLAEKERTDLSAEVQRLSDVWREIQKSAPGHLAKVEFRLGEQEMLGHMREVERQLQTEDIAFQQSKNVAAIIRQHNDYFKGSDIVSKVDACLEKMSMTSKNDQTLGQVLVERRGQWEAILNRIGSIFSQLEKIPEQWKEYEKKFSAMVQWMDTVDTSLANIFKGEGPARLEEFERAKGASQELCQDVDGRREDMKWLVQKLDQLVSHRADDSGLTEQKRLEGLIMRYKSMMPVIEVTMLKIEVYTKGFAYKDQVLPALEFLEQVDRSTADEKFPASEEAVMELVEKQERLLTRLDGQRSGILSLLQKGKELKRDPNCPEFVKSESKELESAWGECNGRCSERLKALKEHLDVWREYKENKSNMMRLIDETEEEMQKIIPKHDHGLVQKDLGRKESLKRKIKRATDDIIDKMRELAKTLNVAVGSDEQDEALRREVADMEKRLSELLNECDTKIQHLSDLNIKWTEFNQNLSELKGWVGGARKKLDQILAIDISPEDRARLTKELQADVKSRMNQLEKLESDAEGLLGSSPASDRTMVGLQEEVESVKVDVQWLNTSVEEQSGNIACDLDNWNEYQEGLVRLRPWLEKAEVRVAMGLTRPQSMDDAAAELKDLQGRYSMMS